MKRTGQRKKKRKLRHWQSELEFSANRIKFQEKRLEDQAEEIKKQWQKIHENTDMWTSG